MEKHIIDTLQSHDRLKIKTLYSKHRTEFLNFSKKYQIRKEDLVDIYQEAFITVNQKAVRGKLEEIKCSFKTFLFAIAKYMIYDKIKSQNKFIPFDLLDNVESHDPKEFEINDGPELTFQQSLLKEGLKELSEQSRRILTLFYYRGLSLQEIAEAEGYKSVNVVKATKSRALKYLKEKVILLIDNPNDIVVLF